MVTNFRQKGNSLLAFLNKQLIIIIRVTKSRTMRLAGHVISIGEKSNAYRLLLRK
jgi:hypothetical protein